MYITAGTLEGVSGTQLIIQPANDQDHMNRTWRAQPVTVATSASTAITRPVSGTVSDIADGSRSHEGPRSLTLRRAKPVFSGAAARPR